MTQILVTVTLLILAVAAVVGTYRLIMSDGGGPRRSPLPAEPPEGNTILPYPRSRRPREIPRDDVLEQRRRAQEQRGAQYFGGRVNV